MVESALESGVRALDGKALFHPLSSSGGCSGVVVAGGAKATGAGERMGLQEHSTGKCPQIAHALTGTARGLVLGTGASGCWVCGTPPLDIEGQNRVCWEHSAG